MVLKSIAADALALERGSWRLFRDLSFAVRAGEALSVEGPNGIGKTSLLRLIAGFLTPRAGSLSFRCDSETITDPEERMRYVGWLGHQDGIKPQLTPFETLQFFASYFGGSDIEGALTRFGLKRVRDLPAQHLSAGQKKRLAFARLSLSERPLWLLDEPLSALDAAGRAQAAEVLARHCADGGIVIAATHEPLGIPCRHLQLGTA